MHQRQTTEACNCQIFYPTVSSVIQHKDGKGLEVWNSLPQSVVTGERLFSTVQASAGQAWNSVGAQLLVGVMLQYEALPTNYPDPDTDTQPNSECFKSLFPVHQNAEIAHSTLTFTAVSQNHGDGRKLRQSR